MSWSKLRNKEQRLRRKRNHSTGFTLLEIMIGIFILTVGVVGISNIISNIFLYTRLASSKLIAAYLAQEGVEIVRNIRDTNWIEGASAWDDGIEALPGYQHADYKDDRLYPGDGGYLRINGGFYNYDSGEETIFTRKIDVNRKGEALEICAIVEWKQHQRDHEITVCNLLYDWYRP